MDSFNRKLPYAIKVFYTQDTLDGQPFRAFYVRANPNDMKLDFTARVGEGERYTPRQYFEREGDRPYLVMNSTFFSFEDNRNLNVVIKDRQQVAYNVQGVKDTVSPTPLYHYVTRSAIGINGGRKIDVGWVFTDSASEHPWMMLKGPADPERSVGSRPEPLISDIHSIKGSRVFGTKKMPWLMETAVGGGPTLVKRGKIYISSKEELMFVGKEGEKNPRTAMGCTRDNQLIILVIEGRNGRAAGASLPQEAQILLDLGCWEALNLDGGGSSCLLINGKETIRPSDKEGERPVPAVFVIRSNDHE